MQLSWDDSVSYNLDIVGATWQHLICWQMLGFKTSHLLLLAQVDLCRISWYTHNNQTDFLSWNFPCTSNHLKTQLASKLLIKWCLVQPSRLNSGGLRSCDHACTGPLFQFVKWFPFCTCLHSIWNLSLRWGWIGLCHKESGQHISDLHSDCEYKSTRSNACVHCRGAL